MNGHQAPRPGRVSNLAIDRAYSRLMHVRSVDGEERVTPLELFFDLVFVFAITQVTGLPLPRPDVGRSLARLADTRCAVVAWGAYAWLTNTLDPEEGAV